MSKQGQLITFLGLGALVLWAYNKYVLAKNISVTIVDFNINGTIGNQSFSVTFRIYNPTNISATFSGFLGAIYDSNNNKVMDLQTNGSYTIPPTGTVNIPVTGQIGILNLLNSVNDIINQNQNYTLVGSAIIDGVMLPVNYEVINSQDIVNLFSK